MGCALLALAIGADQLWFDRHFLPAFFVARVQYVRMEIYARLSVAIVGIVFVAVMRRRVAYWIADSPSRAVSTALAVVISFGVTELALRRIHLRAAEEVSERKEPLRRLDSRLGWLFVPSRVGYQSNNGRRVQYAFDGNGYRVPRVGQPVDFDRPSVVFTGESMMVGEKLLWPETIPAQTGALLGIQSANIAVSGYATDQAYLRLAAELPRFKHPIAVVSIFTPAIFDRNLDDDRPHLGVGLTWLPPAPHWRLAALARRLIRYRSEESIECGVEVTRQVLRATLQLARARGAVPLIVVPEFVPEEPRESELRKRILDDAGLPYVLVPLDPLHRVPDDGHPDAVASRLIASAVANRLRDLGAAQVFGIGRPAGSQAGTDSANRGLHEKQKQLAPSGGFHTAFVELRSWADPPSGPTAGHLRRLGRANRPRRIHRAQRGGVRWMPFRV